MLPNCPRCELQPDHVYDSRTIVHFGSFYRTSDSRSVQRYRCLTCKKTFSTATRDGCFGQKKRQKNGQILKLLAFAVSQRAIAKFLRINRTTVARKLIFLGADCREKIFFDNFSREVTHMQFDELETFEHTKMKPLSVPLAVDQDRRILGFEVAQMPAKGLLAKRAVKKYGFRKDERKQKRRALFSSLQHMLQEGAIIRSDSNPHYPSDVKKFFPKCHHITCIGQRGAVTGQGELKKIGFDPLFALNHTCAMLRANISRLMRKTWCTTKRRDRLADHISIYAYFHNLNLKST